MAKEYIERETAINRLQTVSMPDDPYSKGIQRGVEHAIDVIKEAPTADVVEVKHGCWVGTADGYADGELVYDMWECSECGYDADGADEKPNWNYCPNCGAKMDGGAENA